MRKIELNKQVFMLAGEEKHFICLGEATTSNDLEEVYIKKIKDKDGKTPFVSGLWGTLGNANDSKIEWTGELECSRIKNEDNFGKATQKEQELIALLHPELEPDNIVERFINFNNIQFNLPEDYDRNNFKFEDLPELRLTLMLEQDEGALVFYQFSDEEKDDDYNVRYIQTEATGKKGKDEYNTDKRDRLTYIFPMLPTFAIEEDEENETVRVLDKNNDEDFVIKILTFKRGKSKDSEGVIKEAIKKLNDKFNTTLEKERDLLLFKPNGNEFVEIDFHEINSDSKTLFLIHGTFGTTEKSFGHLIDSEWLQKRHIEYGGIYEQIITYDHPTLFADAIINIEKLHNMLGSVIFTQNVDIIATSQGGLLAQYLANINSDIKIPVGKIALVSSANGVDYLKSAAYIPTFLKALRKTATKSGQLYAALACLIAQHSAQLFLNRPGMKLMTPGEKELTDIINTPPVEQAPIYLPIIDDYNKKWRNKSIGGLIWRSTLDVLTWTVMGRFNDWVVKTENQYLIHNKFCYISDYEADKFKSVMVTAVHGKSFEKPEVKALLRIFLEEEQKSRTIKEIKEIFDKYNKS
ncbi:MAG: hypothetical protein JEZ09_08540 [Salinivirgaceae bacterium]|nr:hypothetical protein [Salinivirgaceae bacterium]